MSYAIRISVISEFQSCLRDKRPIKNNSPETVFRKSEASLVILEMILIFKNWTTLFRYKKSTKKVVAGLAA